MSFSFNPKDSYEGRKKEREIWDWEKGYIIEKNKGVIVGEDMKT